MRTIAAIIPQRRIKTLENLLLEFNMLFLFLISEYISLAANKKQKIHASYLTKQDAPRKKIADVSTVS